MPSRSCSDCRRWLDRSSYSKNQWSKGDGYSRCHSCVSSGAAAAASSGGGHDVTQTARRNNSTKATFTQYELDHPFASGAFRYVAQGRYTEGRRAGEKCVCKWFKTGGVLEDHFYSTDLQTAQMAEHLIMKWNSKNCIDKMVQVNMPEVWTFTPGSQWSGRKVLQEPFIEEYQKFNSNTGWADDTLPWPRVMQALSHFTYHVSNGQQVLCDLQGGFYSNGVVLTDPVILSVSRSYGPTDLGPAGISTFFAHHQCNEYCRSEWRKPRDRSAYYNATASTTMEHVGGGRNQHVPTHHFRPAMTLAGIYE